MVIFALPEGFDKVTPYHPICSFFVQKVLHPYWLEHKMMGISMGWSCVDVNPLYLTYYLQMILYCFVGLPKGRCRLLLNYCDICRCLKTMH